MVGETTSPFVETHADLYTMYPQPSTRFLLESSSIFRLSSAARPKCSDYKCPKHYKLRYDAYDIECDKDGCRDDKCCEKVCEHIIITHRRTCCCVIMFCQSSSCCIMYKARI